VLLVCYFVFYIAQSCGDAEVHRADDLAWILFRRQSGKTKGLPDKLRGVFWFKTDLAPELLMTMDGQDWDEESHTLTIASGGPLSWTHSTGIFGWIYWAMLRMSDFFCAKLYLKFDPDVKLATMPLYMCGYCPVPMGMWWTIQQIDEHNWDRAIYLYSSPHEKSKFSYILTRVIDEHGNKLPQFDEMMQSVTSEQKVTSLQLLNGAPGLPSKPLMQIMNGARGGRICGGRVPWCWGADSEVVASHEYEKCTLRESI
ncbi:unnamed protein product, partial [Polarella glacialis]